MSDEKAAGPANPDGAPVSPWAWVPPAGGGPDETAVLNSAASEAGAEPPSAVTAEPPASVVPDVEPPAVVSPAVVPVAVEPPAGLTPGEPVAVEPPAGLTPAEPMVVSSPVAPVAPVVASPIGSPAGSSPVAAPGVSSPVGSPVAAPGEFAPASAVDLAPTLDDSTRIQPVDESGPVWSTLGRSDAEPAAEVAEAAAGTVEAADAAGDLATPAIPAPVFRDEDTLLTRGEAVPPVFRDESVAPAIRAVSDEERKLAAERAARREARIRALTTAPASDTPSEPPKTVVVTKRSTDTFVASAGLMVLRVVMAGIFGVRGFELLANRPQAEAVFGGTLLPQPEIWVVVAGFGSMAVALTLLVGLLTRVAGAGAMLVAGGALAFVLWGATWNPFDVPQTDFLSGRYAFLGEFELLAAVVGFMFLCVGGGGWSLDRTFRSARSRDRDDLDDL